MIPLSYRLRRLASRRFPRFLLVLLGLAMLAAGGEAAEWSVPAAGNAFRTPPSTRGRDFRRNQVLAWDDAEARFSIYFHIDRPATLQLALDARVPEGQSVVVVRAGDKEFRTDLEGADWASHPVGTVEIPSAGYVRVDLEGARRSGRVYAEIRGLEVSSATPDLVLDYVKSNEGNMFYWGRRGPSVHLTYEIPSGAKLQYAYCEITVPEGKDPIGSYFMANGFGEGYFGIQVNSARERRVLFSVWSPFRTDDPRQIPEDQRVELLANGPKVHVGEFGNEGSGGQSYLVYPWKAGVTYGFLTEVRPDGDSSTMYTSWFREKPSGAWQLVASFRRPKTTTYLRRFHSFLESFQPAYGHIERLGLWGNVWVCDVDGVWHECTRARLSVDATGRGRHRLDFAGGAKEGHFFLRNCGFFDETGEPGAWFTRRSTADQRPEIDLDALPRS